MAAVILPNIKPIMSSAMVSFMRYATTTTTNKTKKLPILAANASDTSLTKPSEKERLGNEIVRYQADLEHLSTKNKEQKAEVEKLQEKFTKAI